MRKELVILRGLPGSGKSTLAREIVDSEPTWLTDIFSTDDFFYRVKLSRVDGVSHFSTVYTFDSRRLGEAHKWNQARTREAMFHFNEMYMHEPCMHEADPGRMIVIDNTNSEWWETQPYVEAAIELGWNLNIFQPKTAWAKDVAECARRTKHGVPEAAIQRMADRWQEVPENTPGGNPEYVKAIYESLDWMQKGRFHLNEHLRYL